MTNNPPVLTSAPPAPTNNPPAFRNKTSTPANETSADQPAPTTIFILEDDPLMAECISRAADHTCPCSCRVFSNAIAATAVLSDNLPDLVILDVLLNGPNGFTFLNEMISYSDTAQIPVVIITSLRLPRSDLSHYGVRSVLNKDTMTPADIQKAILTALEEKQNAR